MSDECRMKEVCEIYTKGSLNVLSFEEIHLKGCGFWYGRNGDGKGLWEGIEGGAVWAGIGKGRRDVQYYLPHECEYEWMDTTLWT